MKEFVRLLPQETSRNYHKTTGHVLTLCGDLYGEKTYGNHFTAVAGDILSSVMILMADVVRVALVDSGWKNLSEISRVGQWHKK